MSGGVTTVEDPQLRLAANAPVHTLPMRRTPINAAPRMKSVTARGGKLAGFTEECAAYHEKRVVGATLNLCRRDFESRRAADRSLVNRNDVASVTLVVGKPAGFVKDSQRTSRSCNWKPE